MTTYAILQAAALGAFVFTSGLVYGRWRNDAVHRALRWFLRGAFGWALTSFLLFLPLSAGFEMPLKRIAAFFWIPLNLLMLRFAYAMVGRKPDRPYYALAGLTAAALVVYVSTRLGIEGFVRYDWGVAAIRGPAHAAISMVPALCGIYALGLMAHAWRKQTIPSVRKALALIVIGGVVTFAMAFAANMILPVVFGLTGFPELGPFAVAILAPFFYLAITRYDFLAEGVDLMAKDMLDSLPEGVILVDAAGTVQRMNAVARDLLARDEKGTGRHLGEILPQSMRPRTDATHQIKLRRNGRSRVFEVTRSTKRVDGEVLGEVLVLRDITVQKKSELVLLRSREDLRAEVEQRNEELKQAQKLEAIGTIAGGIAHDFNNLLAAIVGFATAAKFDLASDHAVQQDLDDVLQSADRGRDIVRQLMTFTRRREAQRALVDVGQATENIRKLLEVTLPENVALSLETRASAQVFADTTQLHQIILNLATNGCHAMRESGGTLGIVVDVQELDDDFAGRNPPLHAGSHVCIGVTDEGRGIPAEIMARIFEPLFTTKERDQGTGLGLATARRIANEHGGSIVAENGAVSGAVFRVYLPVTEGDADEVVPGGVEQIFLVDDKEDVARAGRRLLEPLGYRVATFTDPMIALRMFREDPYAVDLVITDQAMPKMTGVDLAETMLRIRSDLPVLLISGYAIQQDKLRASAKGIRAFLSKPLERGTLARTVRELIDAPPPSASGALSLPEDL